METQPEINRKARVRQAWQVEASRDRKVWLAGSVVAVFLACATLAFAGQDAGWGCTTVSPSYSCTDSSTHHFSGTFANYTGSGSLPIETGDACNQSGCSGLLFGSQTGENGNGYNQVYSCYEWNANNTCVGANDPFWGIAGLTNLHYNNHTIAGTSYF